MWFLLRNRGFGGKKKRRKEKGLAIKILWQPGPKFGRRQLTNQFGFSFFPFLNSSSRFDLQSNRLKLTTDGNNKRKALDTKHRRFWRRLTFNEAQIDERLMSDCYKLERKKKNHVSDIIKIIAFPQKLNPSEEKKRSKQDAENRIAHRNHMLPKYPKVLKDDWRKKKDARKEPCFGSMEQKADEQEVVARFREEGEMRGAKRRERERGRCISTSVISLKESQILLLCPIPSPTSTISTINTSASSVLFFRFIYFL